jgi:hypothetical protein
MIGGEVIGVFVLVKSPKRVVFRTSTGTDPPQEKLAVA